MLIMADSRLSSHLASPWYEPMLRPSGTVRAWIFLAVCLAIFIFACSFWQYLGSGEYRDFSAQAFKHDLTNPLGESLLQPLSIFNYPWMILVAGLSLAIMIYVPIAVILMCRLPFCVVFILVLAAVGHAPGLACMEAGACAIAAMTRLRRTIPLLAGLTAMVPVAIYLYIFAYSGTDTAGVSPGHRWVLGSPFLAAIVGAIVLMSLTLAAARFDPIRSAALCLTLAAVAVWPAYIFHARIGADHLQYALIISSRGQTQMLFRQTPLEDWKKAAAVEGLSDQSIFQAVQDDLEKRKRAIKKQCGNFLKTYPASPLAPAVMWLDAQRQSIRIDLSSLQAGSVCYSASYPPRESQGAWRELATGRPDSPHGAIAQWQLAQLTIRRLAWDRCLTDDDKRKLVAEAENLLAEADKTLQKINQSSYAPRDRLIGVFTQPIMLPAQAYYSETCFGVRKLRWIVLRNSICNDLHAAQALAALMEINPHDEDYQQKLTDLAKADQSRPPEQQFFRTSMAGNMELASVLAQKDLKKKVQDLMAMAGPQGYINDRDAAIEANFELGRLAMMPAQTAELKLPFKKPMEYFKIVVEAINNPWQQQAAEYIEELLADTQPASWPATP
ncbi:MAG: hypothetical protein HZA50_17355 [Planctomycetes bacterium]|nr:hypothetical protein [Planctomycetota bacterium]